MIPLNIPASVPGSAENVARLVADPALQNEKFYSAKVLEWFRSRYGNAEFLLTKSCTHALELIFHCMDLKPGDEVIMPSWTFVSAGNAVVARGAVPVFCDVDPRTMNLDPACAEAAITSRTRAILVVHYAGVSADIRAIKSIADKHGLYLVEDAAQAILSPGPELRPGMAGDAGAISFDQMKNITCGQGGIVILNRKSWREKAEIIFENGTNKRKFLRGEAPYYSWRSPGSNYSLPEFLSSILLAQLEVSDAIQARRLSLWDRYAQNLADLPNAGLLRIPDENRRGNAHIFFIKCQDESERSALIRFLAERGVMATFHFVPLHSTEFGMVAGRFHGADDHTTAESKKLLRLPLFDSLSHAEVDKVSDCIREFYQGK